MCGHGSIAIWTVLVETRIVEAREPVTEIILDTPAGVVRAKVVVKDGAAESVTIQNVPSFLYKSELEVSSVGRVRVDVAYGGNFYAILPSASMGLEIKPEHTNKIISSGIKIWETINEQVKIRHPEEPEIDCVNYVEFSTPPSNPMATMKNLMVVPPGA